MRRCLKTWRSWGSGNWELGVQKGRSGGFPRGEVPGRKEFWLFPRAQLFWGHLAGSGPQIKTLAKKLRGPGFPWREDSVIEYRTH